MISPNTPAGARIVCISAPAKQFSRITGKRIPFKAVPVQVGEVYVVSRIEPVALAKTGFGVFLVGFEPDSFGLEMFELAALPHSITDCLTAQPIQFNDEIRERDLAVIRHLMPY